MTADVLITRICAGNFTPEEVVQAAGSVASTDAETAVAGRRVVFAALDHYAEKTDKVSALLESIAQHYAGDSVIAQFTRDARAAYDKTMEAVYQKIINPRSGESEYCDPYQVGDWHS